MSRTGLFFAVWTLLAGAGIPLIGVLNSGISRGVGNPISATAVLFGIAFLIAAAIMVPLYGLPTPAQFSGVPVWSYGAGLLMGFYALSATIIIPRFGAGNFVAFILIAQLATSAAIDHLGLFGMLQRPLGPIRLIGLAFVLIGIVLMQFVSRTAPDT